METSIICCRCGADLGDASDPYRDPDCIDCLNSDVLADERQAEFNRTNAVDTEVEDDPFRPF